MARWRTVVALVPVALAAGCGGAPEPRPEPAPPAEIVVAENSGAVREGLRAIGGQVASVEGTAGARR